MHPIKESLDKVSSCFCAAKWLQVTVRLQNGHTHSCHHPKTHKVPLSELNNNPSALHNTNTKKIARKMMLENQRPSECSYCWKVEDLPGHQVSDRFYKSSDDWARPYLAEVAALPWNANVNPKYLEVSFSNICNFKCAYCFPDVSTKWMSEIIEHGPYPTSDHNGSLVYLKKEGTLPISEKNNLYTNSFWRWLPEIISDLHVLRVTGGEPLLSKDCNRLFQFLHDHANPKLDFSINTNLGVPTQLVKDTLQQLKSLKEKGNIKEAHLFTSLDTWGDQAQYIRFGLDLKLWLRNLDLCLLEGEFMKTNIMVTFNALSVFHFLDFLKFTLEQKQINQGRLGIDISILHSPCFLSVLILSRDHLHLLEQGLQFMKENSAAQVANGFYDHEISKMQRLLEFTKHPLPDKELKKRRIDFVAFILEYDRRKKTDFLATFPQMKDDFQKWRELYDSQPPIKFLKQEVLRQGQKWLGRYLV